MQFRFGAGSEVLRAADILKAEEDMAPMTVEGGLLVFDFEGLDFEGVVAKITAMDTLIGVTIADVEDTGTMRALTALKNTLVGLAVDAGREYAIIADREARARGETEAAPVDAGSHPTSTGDAAISNVSQQSSIATQNEETDHEPQEPQSPVEQPRRRNRG